MMINAAKFALNKVGQVVLEGHIKDCIHDGIEYGDADATFEKFTKAVAEAGAVVSKWSCILAFRSRYSSFLCGIILSQKSRGAFLNPC